jgi:uncharacterized membrane protein YukC
MKDKKNKITIPLDIYLRLEKGYKTLHATQKRYEYLKEENENRRERLKYFNSEIDKYKKEIKNLEKWQQQARFFLVLFGFIIGVLSFFLI